MNRKIGKALTRSKSKQRTGFRGKTYLRISAGNCRNKYVHTLIAEAMLGRELTPGECVDHRDDNGLNCRPWNLRVMTIAENTRRRGEPPILGEVIFDGAAWWAQHNPGWIDPLGEIRNADADPEPDHDDAVRFCPDCEKPNQFGELCQNCQREREVESVDLRS